MEDIMLKKKKTKKKVAKKKATKKKVTKKKNPMKATALHEDQNWIYCDRCEEPTGFKHAAIGLETHNVATCADCLTVLDKAKARREEEAYMLNRSRERRARIMSRARGSLNTYRGI